MKRHTLLGQIKDQTLRLILQDLFDKSQSAQDVATAISGATYTINESSGKVVAKPNIVAVVDNPPEQGQ